MVVKPLQVFERHTSHVTLQQLELAKIVNLAPQLLLIFWQHVNQLFSLQADHLWINILFDGLQGAECMAHHFRRPELFLLLVQLLFRWNREVE